MYTTSSYIYSIYGHTSQACWPHVNLGHSLQPQFTVIIGSQHRHTCLCHIFYTLVGLAQRDVSNVMSKTQPHAAILLPGQSPSLAVATHNELPVLSHTQPTLFKAKLWVWLLARIHYGNHRYRLATQTVDSQQRSAMASAPVQPQANNQGLTDTCHYTNTNKIDKARLTNCPVVLKYVKTRVGIDEF